MPIYIYVCKVCDKTNEFIHKFSEQNAEPCKECGASPKDLVRQIAAHTKHSSWSKWNVLGNDS